MRTVRQESQAFLLYSYFALCKPFYNSQPHAFVSYRKELTGMEFLERLEQSKWL